jgi:hypothetical protein
VRVIAWGAVVALAAGVTGAAVWVGRVAGGPSAAVPAPAPSAVRTDAVVDAPAAEPPPPGDAGSPVEPAGPPQPAPLESAPLGPAPLEPAPLEPAPLEPAGDDGSPAPASGGAGTE